MDRVFRFVVGRPRLVLALALVATAFAASRVVDLRSGRIALEFDPSINRLLPENDPAIEFYDHVRLVFGSDETILVVYHADDLFTPEHLGAVVRLTERLGDVDGVHHVTSLANAKNIVGDAGGLRIAPLFSEVPQEPAELARLREAALASPIFAGKLVSADARSAMLLVYLRDFTGTQAQEPIDDAIVRIADEERGSGEIWITGQPHIKVAQYRAQTGELRRDLPLILLVFAGVLWLSFRTARGVVLPLLSVAVALIWTLAVVAWIGRPLNLVTLLAPAVLMILGLSYAVHVVSEYYDELREGPESAAPTLMHAGLVKIWLPVTLTGFTTGVGFLSMMVHPLGAIREVGVILLIGTAFSVVVSLSVVPALLAVLPKPRRSAAGASQEGGDLFDRFTERLGAFLLPRRRAVFVASAVAFAFFCLFATQMQATSDGIRSFSPHFKVRRDFEAINESLGGANAFSVVVESSYAGAFKEPENLRQVRSLQDWLEAQPEIGGATSVADYIEIMNRAFFHDDDPAFQTIPDTRRQVAQLLFFGANDDLEGFIDGRQQVTQIRVRTSLQSSADIRALQARIQERLAGLPEHLEGTVTGNPIVIQSMVDQIIQGQLQSVLVALVVIYLTLWALFLDSRTGLRALLPNILPLGAFYGGMGLFGIPLSTTTSLIAPMALGIAIDDTLHYFFRFRSDAKRLADEQAATVRALRSVGRPMTYTTVTLCLGFLVLAVSDLANQMQFGVMAAFTLAAAWAVDFTLTPALCAGLRIVTLWDTLTLDLGQAPEETIPLFKGLSSRQCRVVAQIANLRSIPKGEALIRAGDEGREMYVVIDGKLRVYIDTDKGPQEFRTESRGEVTGLLGFFGRRRSANIDVLEDARLLRLTSKNMTELARRKPAIAAVLFRNLGDHMSDLISDQTQRERDLASRLAAQGS